MGQNPETNRFENLRELTKEESAEFKAKLDELTRQQSRLDLVRPDGSPVPKHWTTFKIGELVVIKDYTYRVAYIGETSILFEPVRPTDKLFKIDKDGTVSPTPNQ